MKKTVLIVNSIAGAALLTMVAAVATLLALMFTGDDTSGRREAFFGSLMFESIDRSDGATSITAGVEDPVPLVVLFVVLAITLAVIQLTYRFLRSYRDHLRQERGVS